MNAAEWQGQGKPSTPLLVKLQVLLDRAHASPGEKYAKGHHVLIDPKEIDELKLKAKHTIDMVRFVDQDEIDTRYWEKPYTSFQMVTRLMHEHLE